MSEVGNRIRNQRALHYISFAVMQWIDVFTCPLYANILIESIQYCQKNKGLKVYGWCIMPNTIYLIVSASGNPTLSDILRDLKKFTSVKISQAIQYNETEKRKKWMMWIFRKAGEWNNRNDTVQFWQQENDSVEIVSPSLLEEQLSFIHLLPVKSGVVFEPEGYRYSSAIDYCCNADKKGLIQIST